MCKRNFWHAVWKNKLLLILKGNTSNAANDFGLDWVYEIIFSLNTDGFFGPAVTVAKWSDGETKMEVLSGEKLFYWLQDYTLGKLYGSGELEERP